ncbi:Uncharacterized protein SAPIO_CDS8329 [Scedosporium apiospermum]|uniref:Alpha and gamma adaptin binding protein p34 n=1 Tax=Pseudallescheria apiosperma TaxID=563466 RepID=A0A084FZD7_PSEDA|nr:Uncharacterized protein SAPIO_CDS8329 [Scedosporium apiospermum]KEZ40449.1 Uncharacterized protein SAPIO_CDS8329 [Scedosporium apiospermum]
MSNEGVTEITNPRRVLAVSLEVSSHHLSRVVKDLSGTHPTPSPTLSGITHPLPLTTPYYTTTLPLWLDLIEDPEDWAETFLSPEAKEVLEALGGLVVVFEVPKSRGDANTKHDEQLLIEHVGRVVKDGLGGWGWDGVAIAVGLGADSEGVWEDMCSEAGMEFILVSGNEAEGARNEFGEKVGIARALEALQANDWTALLATDDDYLNENEESERTGAKDGLDDEDDDFDFGFYGEKSDFEGLKQAILEATLEREGVDLENLAETSAEGSGQKGPSKENKGKEPEDEEGEEDISEEDVQKIERMMSKLKAVREMGEGMPEEERRRLARRAVDEVMKEL